VFCQCTTLEQADLAPAEKLCAALN
jgi:hypothetical protein